MGEDAAPTNPFEFAIPLTRAEDLVGRERELEELHELARSGTYTLLEAPRRYGKTSLLTVAIQGWREREQGLAVRVDFSRVLTIEEAWRRVNDAYEEDPGHGRFAEVIRELLTNLRVRVGPVELGGAPVGRGPVDPAGELHRLLEMPARLAERTGRRALVTFDEFQDVLSVPGLDGLIRSHIQHHGDAATYVFAGSEPSMLRVLFSDRSQPLYGQAKPLRLGRIDPAALAEAIAAKFEATGKTAGEGGQLVAELGAGHPQRTMLLAWHLWRATPPGTTASRETASAALAAAHADRRAELDGAYLALTDTERRIAVAIAHGLPPTGQRAQRATGIRNRSSAAHATKALLDQGVLEQTASGTTVLVDPLLAIHLRREHPLPAREREGPSRSR